MEKSQRIQDLKDKIAERRRLMIESRERIGALIAIGTEWTDGSRFVGAVTADPAEQGRVRLTLFDKQGPYGHRTRDTLADLVDVIMLDMGLNARPEIGCVDRMVQFAPKDG